MIDWHSVLIVIFLIGFKTSFRLGEVPIDARGPLWQLRLLIVLIVCEWNVTGKVLWWS